MKSDLEARFRVRLQSDAQSLRDFAASAERQPDNMHARRSIEMIAHRLAGSAGLFGFSSLSRHALDVEFDACRDGSNVALARAARLLAAAIDDIVSEPLSEKPAR